MKEEKREIKAAYEKPILTNEGHLKDMTAAVVYKEEWLFRMFV